MDYSSDDDEDDAVRASETDEQAEPVPGVDGVAGEEEYRYDE